MTREEFAALKGGYPLYMLRFAISLGFALLMGACALPLRAELIVFSDGRVTKAVGYQVDGDEVEIHLRGGGSYRVDAGLVERIVEDEVEVSEVEVREVGFDEKVAYDLSYKEDRRPLFATAYDAIIQTEAKKHGVDAALVSAVIRAESNYEPRALSRKGARGLMQLMPATAKRLAVGKPFDPASNVAGGVRYLKELAERFKHRPELVLAAYNAGEHAVEAYGGVPPYRETIGYVKKILSWWTPAVAATVPAAITTVSSNAAPSSK
jgi:transglycosylase-like protein with SLT domain